MRQILQNIANGETQLAEVPCPQSKVGQLLITTTKSLVSVGTERMLIDFGKSGWVEKARSQPDKVKMVLEKVKTDGLKPTIDAVRFKQLDCNQSDQTKPCNDDCFSNSWISQSYTLKCNRC